MNDYFLHKLDILNNFTITHKSIAKLTKTTYKFKKNV